MSLPPRPGRRFGRRGSETRRPWRKVALGVVMVATAAAAGWGMAMGLHRLVAGPGQSPTMDPAPPPAAAKPTPGECRPFTVTVDGAVLQGRACYGADGKWAVAPPQGATQP